jgi:hypothetical protein
MATSTTRLGLRKPDGDPVTGDNIDVALDISGSMDKIDDAVGAHICTSGTRPTGGQRWNGRIIKETDTLRMYIWDAGTSFWLPLLNGRGSGVGPYLLGTSTDTGGEGINVSASVANAHILRSRVTTEANPRLTVDADGRMQWGAGGASAPDTNLYRNAANELKTDDAFSVVGNLTVTGTAAWNKLDVQSPTGTTCTFSSINQNYQHLMIIGACRGTTAATFISTGMQINGNATAIYDSQQLTGNNATAAALSATSTASAQIGESAGASATAGACSTYFISIPNYRGTSFWKTWDVKHTLSTGTGVALMHTKVWSGQFRATGAITSIAIALATGNFATGSTFSLYGLL